ncbi:MAG: alpha/beta hydrolase [Rhodospirillaceae bacterium]|nr:alpha/beta hydrolase [Rhodospirillaceae bacterium]
MSEHDMPQPITRHFLSMGEGQQVHYRRAGHGPPLIIMHPSPNSSASMTAAITAFSDLFTCIALDTPGYGLSDDIVADATELWGYADALARVLDKLGISKTFVYGAATGAQIGIQFARKYPTRVEALLLDANGDFGGEAGQHIATGYFQDITPVRDGTHLLKMWDMCRHLAVYFPWQSSLKADRLNNDVPPPEFIQHYVNDYLYAGPGYKKAYYEAMVVETWENTSQVTVPTSVVRNAASPLLPHTDALIAKGLPENFTILPCTPATRFQVQIDHIKQHLAAANLSAPPPAPADHDAGLNKVQNFYIPARGGQLRVRGALDGTQRPLLALHDPAGSSRLVEPIVAPYIGTRPVLALDLPGNGESDNVIDPANITSAAYAEIVIEALKNAGIADVDIIGRYSGGPIAMEMSFQAPALVRHLVLAGVGIYEGDEQKSLLAHYTPSIAPQWDGSHLVRAWAIMRDQNLFWPWFNRTKAGILWTENAIDVAMIHLRVMEMLKIGDQYQKAYAAMWTYPMRERLPRLKAPALFAVPTWEAIYAKNADCAALAPHASVADLSPKMADWHNVLTPFFAAP